MTDAFAPAFVGDTGDNPYERQMRRFVEDVVARRGLMLESALAMTPADRWHLLYQTTNDVPDPFTGYDPWAVACRLPEAIDDGKTRWIIQEGRTIGCSWSIPLRPFNFPMIVPDDADA